MLNPIFSVQMCMQMPFSLYGSYIYAPESNCPFIQCDLNLQDLFNLWKLRKQVLELVSLYKNIALKHKKRTHTHKLGIFLGFKPTISIITFGYITHNVNMKKTCDGSFNIMLM